MSKRKWTCTFTTTATAYGTNCRAIITFPAWNYLPKKKNDISAYGDIGICGIFGSIKRYFKNHCYSGSRLS